MNQGISKQSLLLKSSAIFQKPRLNEANFKLNLKIKIPNFKKAIKTSFPFIFQEYLKLGIILHAFPFIVQISTAKENLLEPNFLFKTQNVCSQFSKNKHSFVL